MRFKIIFSFFLLFVFSSAIFALTGKEIMDKVDALPEPKSAKMRALMTIHKGRILEKEFATLMKKIKGNNRMIMSFIRPTRIKILSHAHKGKDDDQWIRLSSGKVKRIAGGDKSKAVVNSHFCYEDMSSVEIDKSNYKYLGDKKVAGVDCYMVEAVKKKGQKVYDKTVIYVRKSDNFVLRVDFYLKGKLQKYLEMYDIKKIKGIITPKRILMTRADGKGKTEIKFTKIKYNIKIKNSKFSKEALR